MRPLVVLPTYNEAESIADVLQRVRVAVPDAHVLVIDDGSPDGTADLVEKLAHELGRIEVLRRPAKMGLGSAYRAGFRVGLARGFDVMVEMDADLSHDPDALPEVLAPVRAGLVELVVGSRYVPGGRIPDWSFLRRFISRFGNLYARALLGISVHDSTSGYRAYSRRGLGLVDLDRVRADGYGFQIEMAYRIERAGGRVLEVPIEFKDRTLGTSKMSGRIVVEALVLVTWWGIRDRFCRMFGRRGHPRSTERAGA